MPALKHARRHPLALALALFSAMFAVPAAGQTEPEPSPTPAESSTPAPPEPEAAPDVGDEEPDPVVRATTRIRAALAAITGAELALAAGSAAHAASGQAEAANPGLLLEAARLELHEALVALGAAREQQRLQAWLDERLEVPVESAAVSDEPDPTPMETEPAVSASTLEEVRRAIESAPFKDDKMQVLRINLTAARVSSEQVAELLELFTLSSHRVDALVFLHPRITDPEKFNSLLATLKFESDRQTVLERLGLGG